MVTVAQARSQLTTQRSAVQQQQQQVQQARQQIEQSRLRALTRAELQRRTREDILVRKQQLKQLEREKKVRLSQFKPIETQLGSASKQLDTFEREIRKAEVIDKARRQQQIDIKQAFDAFDRGSLKPDANRNVIKIFDQIQASAKAQKQFSKQQSQLQTLKPPVMSIPPIIGTGQTNFIGEFSKQLITDAITSVKDFAGKTLKIPVFIGVGGKVEATKVREGIRELGLAGKVVAEFVPTTRGDLAIFSAVAGAATASKIVRVGIGVLGGLTALDTKQAPETRIAGTIVAIAPLIAKIGLPKGKKASAQAFAELESFFKRQTKKKSKLDLLNIQDSLRLRRVGKKIVREKTRQEKLQDVRKIFDKIRETRDPILKQKQIQGIIKFLEATYGKAKARSLLLEFLAEEGVFVSPKKTTFSNIKKLVRKRARQKPKAKIALTPKQRILQRQTQKTAQKQKKKQLLAVGQITSQIAKQQQRQKLKEKNIFFIAPKALQKQVARERARRRAGIKIKPKPKPRPFIKPKKLSPQQAKLRKAIKKLGAKNAVDVLVGLKLKKRKVIARGLPPYRAIRRGQRFVDRNIQASYVLRPTGKKTKKKDISPFLTSRKFRQSKTNPLFQVEKKRHRLDHSREVFQLKAAKKAKIKFPSGFFPKVKKRRKRKEKK